MTEIIVFRATKLDKWCSKIIPYWIPFINKRKRVKIRNYFRYRFRRKLMKTMVEQLSKTYISSGKIKDYMPNFNEEDYTWEVITKH